MKIGPFTIDQGAALAPMAGITNPPFRKLCKELGAALTSTELVSSYALVYLVRKSGSSAAPLARQTGLLMERFEGEVPFAVQIFGRDPDRMAEAARIAEARGADIVDLNFSCPARKVVKNGLGAGVALMLDLPRLGQIARAVVDAVSVPVTAKIRAGYSPQQRNGAEAAKRLEQAGVQAICVHARTRDQVHSGPVDLEILARITRGVRIPVIGNGNIRSRADAEEMIARAGCARVAIGQAAKGNPWIFAQVLGQEGTPSLAARIALCRRHLELYLQWTGDERRAVLEMRKHACWYLKGFCGAARFRCSLALAEDEASFHRLLGSVGAARETSGDFEDHEAL